jgi:hypothetical protein
MGSGEIAPHGQESGSADFWPRSRFYQGQYGRLFRELPPLGPWSGTKQEEHLNALGGRPGSGAGTTIPAGYTYFGQFIAHDITFNPVSDLTRQRDPSSIISFRTPALDLDSLYGRGPKDSAYFYDRTEGAPRGGLSVGWGTGFREDDLPRTEAAVALIGDPRNDENTMVSQLHLAFIKLHNHFCQKLGDFAQAQAETIWHYQWVILNDYLPRLCLDKVLNRIWGNSPSEPTLKWFKWKNSPFIPLEFSGAALRFGHSMVRNDYELNFAHPVPIPLFGSTSLGSLRGFRRLPLNWTVQWDNFLKFTKPGARAAPQPSMPIDFDLSRSLMNLPKEAVTPDPREAVETNLRKRNVARGFQLDLPSGQAVARAISAEQVVQPVGGNEDPLWIYVLREAQEHEDGSRLGEVGSTIVAETLSGLIYGDPLSYLTVNPGWTPSIQSEGKLQLRDLIQAAGMPIVADDLRRLPAFSAGKQDPRVKCMKEAEQVRQMLAGTAPAGAARPI